LVLAGVLAQLGVILFFRLLPLLVVVLAVLTLQIAVVALVVVATMVAQVLALMAPAVQALLDKDLLVVEAT
jgi:hypothetical protein